MSEENTTVATDDVETGTEEVTPAEESRSGTEAPPESVEEAGESDDSAAPDFQERYEALAAQLDALTAKLSDTPAESGADEVRDELVAATARVADVERQLLRQTVAHQFSLPAELVDRLQGNDQESITADAKALAAVLHTPRGLGKGGLNPSEAAFDAKGLVQAYRRGVNGGL
ncbi:hypothetical protein ABZ714_13195 [Streptomyces sp. NPDC006798]|uniref:hypothetical protein n=1 Tax=Streptomyces sp. NPDC006798 TaxID=3155462 RepID=UPI0033E4B72B